MRNCATGIGFAGLLFAGGMANAAVVAYEGFDYGATAGPLIGKGAGGGNGFTRDWANTLGDPINDGGRTTYENTGLTFSNLTVTGGRANQTLPNGFAKSELNRRFGPAGGSATNLTGTIYAGFLYQSVVRSNTGTVAGLLIAGEFDEDNPATAGLNADVFGSDLGSTRFEGTDNVQSGTALSSGTATTYLYLAKLELNGGTQTAKSWTLSVDQFDNFKNGSLTESALDAATLGTGSTNVWARSTLQTRVDSIGATSHLQMFAYNGNAPQTHLFDEIRLSDASLAEVAPIPEPASLAVLAVAGFGLLARRRVLAQ